MHLLKLATAGLAALVFAFPAAAQPQRHGQPAHQAQHARPAARPTHHPVRRARSTAPRARHAIRHHGRLIHRERRAIRSAHRAISRERHATHAIRHRVRRDLRHLRGAVRAHRRYHWRAYHRPPGWYYRRWGYGQRLPPAWWTRNYWISNWGIFGLFAPPPGYVWVRVGPDAMLIDVNTGIILRVVYGLFYY